MPIARIPPAVHRGQHGAASKISEGGSLLDEIAHGRATLRASVKVALLTNVVPAYRRPVFEALHETPGVCLRLFLSFPIEMSDREARKSLKITHSRGVNLKWRTR